MILAVLAAALTATAAGAQDRSPAQRQRLLDLAYALGESHALKRACDPDDLYWYDRMERLLDVEQPDMAFRNELVSRFNTAFEVREAQFPECDAAARAEAAKAARRGRAVAAALSRIR